MLVDSVADGPPTPGEHDRAPSAKGAVANIDTVSRYGELRAPRSRALIASALIRARSASASCEKAAAVRKCRNSVPNAGLSSFIVIPGRTRGCRATTPRVAARSRRARHSP